MIFLQSMRQYRNQPVDISQKGKFLNTNNNKKRRATETQLFGEMETDRYSGRQLKAYSNNNQRSLTQAG